MLYGNDFDEAKAECMRLKELNNLTFIHPFDGKSKCLLPHFTPKHTPPLSLSNACLPFKDPYIIAGQGTVGVEILRQLRQDRLDAIFVCCGGGGLISGIAAYVKRIRPETKVIGVSTIDSDAMHQSLQRGNIVTLKTAGLFSDGTSIKVVGKETFRLCQQLVDDFVLVSNDELCSAIKDTFGKMYEDETFQH